MKLVPVFKRVGEIIAFTQVDDEDYEWVVSKGTWRFKFSNTKCPNPIPYVVHHTNCRGKQVTTVLHRAVVGATRGQIVDHINGDTLDNRRANLRICSSLENTRNARKRGGGTSSIYKGVSWWKNISKWGAYIRVKGKLVILGYFDDEVLAAKAYDKAALETFGRFSRLNFPTQSNQ